MEEKYLVHAVGMFRDFKHYHISFIETEFGGYPDDFYFAGWKEDAEMLLLDKVGERAEDVYIVGFNLIS